MTFIEFIGFIITMIIFFVLVLKQARDQQQRGREISEEEYEGEDEGQEDAISELLESLNVKVEGKPPKAAKIEEKYIHPSLPERIELSKVEMPQERFVCKGVEKDKRLIEKERRRIWKKPKIPTPISKFGREGKEVFQKPHKGSRVRLEDLQPHHEEAFQILKRQRSRVRKTIGELGSLKDAIIIREILGPPKGLK